MFCRPPVRLSGSGVTNAFLLPVSPRHDQGRRGRSQLEAMFLLSSNTLLSPNYLDTYLDKLYRTAHGTHQSFKWTRVLETKPTNY